MKLNPFKSEKPKDKRKTPKSSAGASQISKLEAQLNDWTDNLKHTEQRLKKLSGKVDETPESDIDIAHPHRPIKELSLEVDNPLDEEILDEDTEDINVVKIEGLDGPAPDGESGDKSNSAADSFK